MAHVDKAIPTVG